MGSFSKDQSSMNKYKHKSREEDVSQQSVSYWNPYKIVDRQTRPL